MWTILNIDIIPLEVKLKKNCDLEVLLLSHATGKDGKKIKPSSLLPNSNWSSNERGLLYYTQKTSQQKSLLYL